MKQAKRIIITVLILILFSNSIALANVGFSREQSCLIVGEVLKAKKYNICEKTFDWDPEGFCGDDGYKLMGGAEYAMQFDTKLINKKSYKDANSKELCNNLEIGSNYEFHYVIREPEDENILAIGDIYTSSFTQGNQLGEIKKGNKLLYNYYSYYLLKYWHITTAVGILLIAGIILLAIFLKRKKSKKDKITYTKPKEPFSN